MCAARCGATPRRSVCGDDTVGARWAEGEAEGEEGERRVHGRGRGGRGGASGISAGTRVREGRCAPASTLARQRSGSLPEGGAQLWSEQLWSERRGAGRGMHTAFWCPLILAAAFSLTPSLLWLRLPRLLVVATCVRGTAPASGRRARVCLRMACEAPVRCSQTSRHEASYARGRGALRRRTRGRVSP